MLKAGFVLRTLLGALSGLRVYKRTEIWKGKLPGHLYTECKREFGNYIVGGFGHAVGAVAVEQAYTQTGFEAEKVEYITVVNKKPGFGIAFFEAFYGHSFVEGMGRRVGNTAYTHILHKCEIGLKRVAGYVNR